jgi:hypothetical protein
MIYTVVWTDTARDQLAAIWVQASNRQAITDAGDRIDPVLRSDPETKGTLLGAFSILSLPPLAVLYHVSPDDRMVKVLAIRRI